MRSIIAKCGHVTRRLNQNEPLAGKVLEFAISVIKESMKGDSDDKLLSDTADKLTVGKKLSEYEDHVLRALLLHKRLRSY